MSQEIRGRGNWEWQKRRDRIQHALYSKDLTTFDFVFFPQLKSDVRGKQLSDLDELHRESDPTKRHGLTWFDDIYAK